MEYNDEEYECENVEEEFDNGYDDSYVGNSSMWNIGNFLNCD